MDRTVVSWFMKHTDFRNFLSFVVLKKLISQRLPGTFSRQDYQNLVLNIVMEI